jgi:hypothetical protein
MAKLAVTVVEADARVEVVDVAVAVEIEVTILVTADKATQILQTRVLSPTQTKRRPNSAIMLRLRNRSVALICRKPNQLVNRGRNRDNLNPNRTYAPLKRLPRSSPINRFTSSRIVRLVNLASRIRYFHQGQDRPAAATSSD